MDDREMRHFLLEIEKVIKSVEFERWRRAFVDENCQQFDYAEENKLIYTDIHRLYEEQLEKRIFEGLPDDFDLKLFMEGLPAFIESGKEGSAGDSVTILLQVSDFNQFKEMMLFRKRELEELESKVKGEDDELYESMVKGRELELIDVDVMMDQCSSLANAAKEDAGWENLLTLDWMKIDKKPVEPANRKSNKEIYLRGIWTMNLSFIECCDMMFTVTERRKLWDNNFTRCDFLNDKDQYDSDVITTAYLDFGYLVNLVMWGGGEGRLTCRNIRRWGVPIPGSVTYAMFPWDLGKNTIDTKHKLLSLKTGTIVPHPDNPRKCIMTTLEKNSMGGMPRWALHWMMRATAPQMMKGLESRYIANAREKGKVEEDFVAVCEQRAGLQNKGKKVKVTSAAAGPAVFRSESKQEAAERKESSKK